MMQYYIYAIQCLMLNFLDNYVKKSNIISNSLIDRSRIDTVKNFQLYSNNIFLWAQWKSLPSTVIERRAVLGLPFSQDMED
mgnify:CR=1 FL=1